MPRTVVMMISELDYDIMNNEVVVFFFFLFCRLFLDSGRLHKNDTCCLLLFIYCFDVVQRSLYGTGHDNLPADVLWGRNECVTNEPQRTSAGRLGTRGRHECLLRRAPFFPAPITSWPVNRRCFIFLFVLFKNIGKLASEASAEREKEK